MNFFFAALSSLQSRMAWIAACKSFFFLSVGVRSLWQPELPDETPAGARLQGEGRGAAARHSPLVAWRAPRPARLTPPPAGQEVERGQGRGPGKGCMEVEVGIGDNQYPMHLSISYSRIEGERTLREGTVNGLPLCPLLACDWGCFRWHREKRGETLQ